jgi:hypothetical protein
MTHLLVFALFLLFIYFSIFFRLKERLGELGARAVDILCVWDCCGCYIRQHVSQNFLQCTHCNYLDFEMSYVLEWLLQWLMAATLGNTSLRIFNSAHTLIIWISKRHMYLYDYCSGWWLLNWATRLSEFFTVHTLKLFWLRNVICTVWSLQWLIAATLGNTSLEFFTVHTLKLFWLRNVICTVWLLQWLMAATLDNTSLRIFYSAHTVILWTWKCHIVYCTTYCCPKTIHTATP